MTPTIRPLLVLFALGAACAGEHPATPPLAPAGETLVKVNGVALGEADLQARLRSSEGHGGELTPERRRSTLEVLVGQEVLAQKARALGLDRDPRYVDAMRAAQAQVAALRRSELAQAFVREQVAAKVDVTDEQVRRYFDAHARQLGTEYQVAQILRRDRAAIDKAAAALREGRPFEGVAVEGYPTLDAASTRPWVMPYMRWQQLPEAWHEAVGKLMPGETSGVVAGPGGRFWLLQLLDRRDVPGVTYESVAPALKEQLRSQALEALREKTEAELRAAAKVEYVQAAP